MINQYCYTINSTRDIAEVLEDAGQKGISLTYFNSVFDLRGEAGRPIVVDSSLKDLFVVARGPAPVWVLGEPGVAVRARESSTVYATGSGYVDARDTATVYAYDCALVDVRDRASVYVASDDVDIDAAGYSTSYLPAAGDAGSEAIVSSAESSTVIRGAFLGPSTN